MFIALGQLGIASSCCPAPEPGLGGAEVASNACAPLRLQPPWGHSHPEAAEDPAGASQQQLPRVPEAPLQRLNPLPQLPPHPARSVMWRAPASLASN